MATCSDYINVNAVTSTSGHHDHLPRRDTFKICGRFCSCPTDHTFTVLPPKSCVCVATPFCPERPAREPASKGHTGGGSRKNAKPAGPLPCTTIIKSDFCARTIQVALRGSKQV